MKPHLDLGAFVADAVREAVAPLAHEIAALHATVERLVANREAELLDTAALARLFGTSTRAMRMRLARRSGDELRAIAVEIGGRRHWRRTDVEALIRRRGAR